jgi:Predicted transcriptional regulators
MAIYKELLIDSGLNSNEAEVYEYLLKTGEAPVSEIIKNTPLKKGVIYLALEELAKKGLAAEKMLTPKNPNVRNKKKIAYFAPGHPEKLREYLSAKEMEIKKSENSLEANISDLVSSFNLVSGKPGVRYFEGDKGIEKTLDDSLTSREIIYTYADIEAVVKNIKEANERYVTKRDKLEIKKRVILLDSPFAREYMKNYHRETTDFRFMDGNLFPFDSLMEIYDGKISYVTFSANSKIGVIIQDQSIYQMHKSIFEHNWEHAKPLP